MSTSISIPALVAIATLTGGCASSGTGPATDTGYVKIMSVTAVQVTPVASGVRITATGQTKMHGWIRPQLVPANYVAHGQNYRLEFVANPPRGVTEAGFTPITASYTIEALPQNVKTITVTAETNSKTVAASRLGS